MIRKSGITEADRENLRSIAPDPALLKDDFYDYRGVVILKPWGYEYLLYQNETVAVWVLFITYNSHTSFHCHPNKKTSLSVLSGQVLFTTAEGRTVLKAGEGLIIDKGVFHSTKSISPEGVIVAEIETPTNKRDLVRLNDAYGRKTKGYEGKEFHIPFTKGYEDLPAFYAPASFVETKKIGKCTLHLLSRANADLFREHEELWENSLVGILNGSVRSADGFCCGPADVLPGADLKSVGDSLIVESVDALIIKNE